MLRLLYLLLRQRVRGDRRLRQALVPGLAALLLCAAGAGLTLSYLSLAPAPRIEATAGRNATLRLRVDAIESAPLVVFLEIPGASVANAGAAPARITSVKSAFEPAFQVASIGTELEVSNRDPIPHNTHLFSGARRTLFNVAVPSADVQVRKPLTRPGIFDVRCDLHPWMRAWVFVPPGAHHAVLWTPGEVTLPDIAPGRYRLHIWQPARGEATRTLTFASGDTLRLVH